MTLARPAHASAVAGSPFASTAPAANAEALARAVVLALAADDAIDERELDLLVRLDAYARLGLPEAVFLRLADEMLDRLGGRFRDKAWLSLADTELLDEVLDRVRSPADRLLVCRLVAGVITADGAVSPAERLIYEHMLMRWRLTRSDVAGAIRANPVPVAAGVLGG